MKFAKCAKRSGLKIEMLPALKIVEEIYQRYSKEPFITHTDDGSHSVGSLHPYGYAFDLRTWYFRAKRKQAVFDLIKARLPKGFDIVFHKTHFHIEWDDAKKLIMVGKV